MANQVAKAASSKPARPRTRAGSSTATDNPAQSKPNSHVGSSVAPITADTRRAMIAEAAYYIAEQRGFGDGRDVEDWLIAEKQIDAKLSA